MDLSRALEVALEAAREAGALLRDEFHRAGGPRGVGDKADADVEAEALIRSRLLREFSRFSYLGEETGRAPGEPGAPVWLVDPNDGTRDYLVGRRGSAISIGLIVDSRPVLGVVFAFAYPDDEGDLFAWAEGCGPLKRNSLPSEARLPPELGPLEVVLVSSQADRDPRTCLESTSPARYRSVPSIAHRLALVAAGEGSAAASLHAPGAWDYAAGQALLRPAGGVLLNEHGEEVGYAADGSSRTLRAFAGSQGVATALAGRARESTAKDGGAEGGPLRLRRGEAVTDPALLSRAQGCLLGQVAGSNLGNLVESWEMSEVAARYPGGPRQLEDGGRWEILAGQPTGGSEMALVLGRSLAEDGSYDPARVLAAYRTWYRSDPFDIGATTRAALVGYLVGESQESGSLMRASPLALFAHALVPEQAAELARLDCALTHPNPVCRDAAGAYVVAVSKALNGAPPAACHAAAVAWARGVGAKGVVEALQAAAGSPPILDAESPAFVLLALRNAFFEMLHAPSLEAGVVATVRRGGNTDVNAGVAGGLLGAVHGRDAVPPQWRQMVLSCHPHPLRVKRPRPSYCWPVDLLVMAERLLLAGRAAAGGGEPPRKASEQSDPSNPVA